jgi:hypothetical protein
MVYWRSNQGKLLLVLLGRIIIIYFYNKPRSKSQESEYLGLELMIKNPRMIEDFQIIHTYQLWEMKSDFHRSVRVKSLHFIYTYQFQIMFHISGAQSDDPVHLYVLE